MAFASRLALLLVCWTTGLVSDAYLGVMFDDKERPTVAEVVPGSPAEKAGVRVGDVFLAIDGVSLPDVAAVREAMRKQKPGDRVRLKVRRGAEELELNVQLGRPFDEGEKGKEPGLRIPPVQQDQGPDQRAEKTTEKGAAKGVGKSAEKPAAAPYLGISVEEDQEGLSVREVLPDSPAERAGVAKGDKVLRFGGEPVKTLEQLDAALKKLEPGTRVALTLGRGGQQKELEAKVGARPSLPAGKRDEGAEAERVREPAPAPSGAQPARLTRILADAKAKGRPALVVFGAPWSPGAQAQRRALESEVVQQALAGHAQAWVDTDQEGQLADQLGIKELPTLVLYDAKGAQLAKHAGYLPPDLLLTWLSRERPSGSKGGDGASAVEAADLRALRDELARLRHEVEQMRADVRKLVEKR